jgi:hypothetical protein
VQAAALKTLVAHPEDLAGHPLHRGPALRSLDGYLRSLTSLEAPPSSELAPIISVHLLDLVAASLGPTPEAEEIVAKRGVRAARLRAVLAEVARRFSEPDFDLDNVAHTGHPETIGNAGFLPSRTSPTKRPSRYGMGHKPHTKTGTVVRIGSQAGGRPRPRWGYRQPRLTHRVRTDECDSSRFRDWINERRGPDLSVRSRPPWASINDRGEWRTRSETPPHVPFWPLGTRASSRLHPAPRAGNDRNIRSPSRFLTIFVILTP